MDTKEIAKAIRKDLKEMGGFKFSVTMERYAGGSSIDVSVMESPARLIRTIDEIPDHTTAQNYSRVQIAEMQLKNYHQLNHHFAHEEYSDESWNNGVFLTKAGHSAVKEINEIIQKYHWDKSDPMTDYFHTNFYYHIGLGKWNKDFVDGE